MKHLKLTLRQNAKSFLEDALRNAIVAEQNPARWKFAVLSMVQAIELSLKQLLYEVHPLFVFENIDKTTKTVGLDHAIKRLTTVKKLNLSSDEAEALKSAKNARDEITHYEVDQNIQHLKLSFSRLLGFLGDFHRAHFAAPLYEQIDQNLWTKGLSIQEYGKELHKRACKHVDSELELTEYDNVIPCLACNWRPMVVLEDGDASCYVCGYKTNITFCSRCDSPFESDEEKELDRKNHCQRCFEYLSDDYWHESQAGK